MKITIIGTGYVGLVTAACLADVGNAVLCIDVDAAKIDDLNAGIVSIHEPDLSALVATNRAQGRLMFSTSYDDGVAHGDVIFLAVGTPPKEDGSADLSHILAAARGIGKRMTRRHVIVNKSTVPVGTVDEVRHLIECELGRRGMSVPFTVLSNPEFLKEGSAVADFMRPDRIIIGHDDSEALGLMRELYAPFNRNHDRILEMDAHSAELTKYAANAMLAARISFMNEVADLADVLGADIEAVRRGIGSDPRIGPHFLYAGAGYGGSCFPKDVRALRCASLAHGNVPHMLNAIESVNERQKSILFRKLCLHYGDPSKLSGKVAALWGLSFKPNTNDMREAPSLILIDQLLRAGCRLQAYDPVAITEAKRQLHAKYSVHTLNGAVNYAATAWEAVEGADMLFVVTEWKEFRALDFPRLAGMLRDRVLFDGRNLYDPGQVARSGLTYYGIGRERRETVQ